MKDPKTEPEAPTPDAAGPGVPSPATVKKKCPQRAVMGNINGLLHGMYRAKQKRDKFRKRGEAEARGILAASGLGDSPLAKMVARQIGRLESMISRLEDFHDRRGHFKTNGDLKASVGKQMEIIGGLLDRAQRLFQQLQEGTAGQPTVNEFRLIYSPHICPKCGHVTARGPEDEAEIDPFPPALPQLPALEDPGVVVEAAAEPLTITPESAAEPPEPESTPSPEPKGPSQPMLGQREPTPAERCGWRTVIGDGDDDW